MVVDELTSPFTDDLDDILPCRARPVILMPMDPQITVRIGEKVKVVQFGESIGRMVEFVRLIESDVEIDRAVEPMAQGFRRVGEDGIVSLQIRRTDFAKRAVAQICRLEGIGLLSHAGQRGEVRSLMSSHHHRRSPLDAVATTEMVESFIGNDLESGHGYQWLCR